MNVKKKLKKEKNVNVKNHAVEKIVMQKEVEGNYVQKSRFVVVVKGVKKMNFPLILENIK